jgi:hypothetical protein
MHYALQEVCPAAVVLEAFDVNHAANAVYAHNFGKAPRQASPAGLMLSCKTFRRTLASQLLLGSPQKPGKAAP